MIRLSQANQAPGENKCNHFIFDVKFFRANINNDIKTFCFQTYSLPDIFSGDNYIKPSQCISRLLELIV